MTNSSNDSARRWTTKLANRWRAFHCNSSGTPGDWQRIFDRQIELINNDVARARLDGRLGALPELPGEQPRRRLFGHQRRHRPLCRARDPEALG